MTSYPDEIRNLREGLDDIARSCAVHARDQEATHPTVAGLLRGIEQMARRTLKTPRASTFTRADRAKVRLYHT